MRPKVVLMARVKAPHGRYELLPIQMKNGRPVEPDEATTYYLRYSQNGKGKVEPVGSNLDRAFVADAQALGHQSARMALQFYGSVTDEVADKARRETFSKYSWL
jgi:hypothetical protein